MVLTSSRRLTEFSYTASATSSACFTGCNKYIPMPHDTTQFYLLCKEVGPTEGKSDHTALAPEMDFSFHTLLGELLYGYITLCPYIG